MTKRRHTALALVMNREDQAALDAEVIAAAVALHHAFDGLDMDIPGPLVDVFRRFSMAVARSGR